MAIHCPKPDLILSFFASTIVTTGLVNAIAFIHPHQTQNPVLASSSEDQTIQLWDIETGQSLKILRTLRPYEGMNIKGVVGLTESQRATLFALGAVEETDTIFD
ncbi:MAG: hypothetical protein RMX65_029470 [Nostoc sp. DedQUE01]|nr:hypothetical protein [Nostoc sp. DedQUE01]